MSKVHRLASAQEFISISAWHHAGLKGGCPCIFSESSVGVCALAASARRPTNDFAARDPAGQSSGAPIVGLFRTDPWILHQDSPNTSAELT
jgi:hypothetical protein